jgi:SAM-dependent methyltransferase
MNTDTDTRRDAVWQAEALSSTYLDGVRGAIPLAAEQIDILMRLARAARPAARAILDLGCGDGILGHALLDAYAAAQPTLVLADFSPPMLDAARARLVGRTGDGRRANGAHGAAVAGAVLESDTAAVLGDSALSNDETNIHFVLLDYAKTDWPVHVTTAPLPARYDVIVSGFSIHHQPDPVKRRIYADIYDLLAPGGIFLNLEHVASASRWGEVQFEAYFIDALARYHAPRGKTRGQVAADFYHRPDKDANRLAPLETQLRWLRELGFQHVDCFFKVFELALFGGVKG